MKFCFGDDFGEDLVRAGFVSFRVSFVLLIRLEI